MFVTRLLLTVCVLFIARGAYTQATDKYHGKLTGLRPDVDYMYQRVFSTTSQSIENFRFEPKLPPKTIVSSGMFTDDRVSSRIVALLIEPPNELPSLAFDLNSDSKITANERFAFNQIAGVDGFIELGLSLPITHRLFSAFPVYVRYYRGFQHPQLEPTDRLLDQSVWAYAVADVLIDGKAVSFRYPFDPKQPDISTTKGQFGLDVDGDGAIGTKLFSLETSYANDAEVVFRYGE